MVTVDLIVDEKMTIMTEYGVYAVGDPKIPLGLRAVSYACCVFST
jgi:hypothetical protein